MQNDRKFITNQFKAGLKSGIPVIFGFIPVGIAYAIMARQAGFSIFETVFMSLSVYAGASQMMAVGMVSQGASIISIIIATFILNFRHLIMSTCIMERLPHEKKSLKSLVSFWVTDESFAVFTSTEKENWTIPFFAGLAFTTYFSWAFGSLLGAIASNYLPDIVTASFGIALYAMFISLLVPSAKGNVSIVILICMTAILNTILSQFLSMSWSLMISTLGCAFIGVYFVKMEETL